MATFRESFARVSLLVRLDLFLADGENKLRAGQICATVRRFTKTVRKRRNL